MKPHRSILPSVLLALSLGTTAVLVATSADAQHEEKAAKVEQAIAIMIPTEGNDVKGVVMFLAEGDKIRVKGKITGLTPGEHGFHVHEFGDQSAPDGTSAGGHFDPTGMPHGAQDSDSRHVGDLGNVTANDDGVAEIDIEDSMLSFSGESSILGRGLVVHGDKDDLTSQPSGDAGPRVAVGIIGVMNPESLKKD
ncbi:hypothetical protein BH23VER1_BH23VER1_22520 [soil metagenome]